jgi:DNA-binding response OmpR family regulator
VSATRVALFDADPCFLRVLAVWLRAAGAQPVELSAPPSPAVLIAMRARALVVDPTALQPDIWRYLESLCGQLPHVGVLICTGPSTRTDRVRALRGGVDDWITKPCHPEELVARIEAVARRRRPLAAREGGGPRLVAEIEIRPDHCQAYVDGMSAELTHREFELLHLLADADGAVLRREEIYARVWGYTMTRGDRSVDVCVNRVRKKLEHVAPGRRYLHTHFGIGYRLAAPAADAAAAPPAMALVAS